jgi:hypothetical protein
MALQPFVGPWPHISVSRSIFTLTVGLLGRVISRRKAPTYTQDNTNTE